MARRLAAHQNFLPIEREVRAAGYEWIAGLDEAGRGPLAGPVVAAAVVLPSDCHIPGLQDSKRLTARQREVVYSRIQQQAVAYGVGSISPRRSISTTSCGRPKRQCSMLCISCSVFRTCCSSMA